MKNNRIGAMNSIAFRITIVLIALGLLAGCSHDMSDLKQKMAAERQKQTPNIEPLPKIEPYETFIYSAEDMRDPFRLAEQEEPEDQPQAAGTGPTPNFDRRKEPLEAYSLDSLEMTGTFQDGDAYWGLVQDPEGLIHRVKVENFMGRNHGQIVSIDENAIRLVELVPNGSGGWEERDASLALEE